MVASGVNPGLGNMPLSQQAQNRTPVSALSQVQGGFPSTQIPNYGSAFQGALDAARGSIAQQLGAALGDIANNQKQAGIALGTLPGQINDAYDSALAQNSKTALGAQQLNQQLIGKGPAGGNYMGGGALGQGMLTASQNAENSQIQNTQNADQQNVPLLAAGIQQMGTQEQAAARMAALGENQQLDMQQASFDQQQQAAAQAQQYAQQNALQNYQYQRQLNDQQNAAQQGLYTEQQAAAQSTAVPGLTNSQVQSAQQNPLYGQILQRMQAIASQGPPGGQNTIYGFSDFQNQLQQVARNDPALWAVIKANAPAGFQPYAKELGMA